MDVAICKVLLEEVVKSFCSAGDRGNVWERGSSVSGVRSMAWSHAFHGGSSSKASLEKTSLKSWYWAGTMSSRGWLSPAFCHGTLYGQTQYIVTIAITHQSLPFSDLIWFIS